jgi:hypothetical protein
MGIRQLKPSHKDQITSQGYATWDGTTTMRCLRLRQNFVQDWIEGATIGGR